MSDVTHMRAGYPIGPVAATSTAFFDASARLRAACAVWIGLWTFGLVMNSLIAPRLSPDQPLDDAWPYPGNPVAFAVIGVSLALFVYLRRAAGPDRRAAEQAAGEMIVPADVTGVQLPVVPARRLRDLAIGYEVFVAAAIGVVNQWTPNTIGLSWICVLILVNPLIVPDSPRRILLGALAAASMDPLGLVVTAARGVPLPETSALIWAVLPNYLCALLASVPARLVAHLNRELSTARELGSYRLGERLGAGGMGEVYLAEHRLLARPAAIKLIRPALLGHADAARRRRIVARFQREAQAIALLRSPHTIALYDYGVTEDGTLYTVMELLDGFDLDTFVGRFGPVPPARAVHLLTQVCDSLGEAHERGLVHRDIKPANVYVGNRGSSPDFVTVLDFGLVKGVPRQAGPSRALTQSANRLAGTPAFMPPEQALGDEVDARSDIYAVGCLAYFLLSGCDVFEGRSALEVLTKHARSVPARPSSVSELELPAELDEVVLACLEKDPASRPQSAVELAQRLEKAVGGALWTAEHARRWWQAHRPSGEYETLARSDDYPSSGLA